MKYKEIISDAWSLTQGNKNLIRYFALGPAILGSIVGIVYMSYQAASFWTSEYFREAAKNSPHAIEMLAKALIQIFETNAGLGVVLIVITAIILILYLLLPVFCQGALIQLTARLRNGHKISMVEGIGFGFNRYLQLFEYHAIIKSFSFVGIITEAAFVFRNLGPDAFAIFGWIFALFLIIGFILTLFFTYSEFYIVIDRKGVFESVLASGRLVIRQWKHTLFMLFLMLLISVRILFNLLAVLLVPLLVIGPIALFTTFTLESVGIVVGIILGSVGLYFASYFIGVFHVFANAVWTFTFLELSAKAEVDLRASADSQNQ